MFNFLGIAGDRGSLSERIQQSDANASDANPQPRQVVPDAMREPVDLTPLRDLIRLLDQAA